jgi:hypothetical protein
VTGGPDGGTTEFFVHRAFWESSQIAPEGVKTELAGEALRGIVSNVRPDILIVDIEGGEADLFSQVELNGVRHVLIELHAAVIGRAGIGKVFQRMSELGFAYDPDCSSSYIVTFSSVDCRAELKLS